VCNARLATPLFDCFANAIFIKPLRRARLKHVKRIERN
jgi:hypothetical protein